MMRSLRLFSAAPIAAALFAAGLLAASACAAQTAPAAADTQAPAGAADTKAPPTATDEGHQVLRLWPGVAPGSEGWTQTEIDYGNPGNRGVRNVVIPTVTVYLPDNSTPATGVGVIIAPGGGFRFEQWDNEGTHIAEYLQKHGVASFVLKYRLTDTGTDEAFAQMNRDAHGAIPPDSPQPAGEVAPYGGGPVATRKVMPLTVADGHQAMRVVKEHAAEWHVDPEKIGIMGFSAGGYIADMVMLDDKPETRPLFVGSIYACCVSTTVNVPSDAPPLFIASAQNDPISNKSGPALFVGYTAAHRPAEIHIYMQGGHGFGTRTHNLPVDTWIDRFGDWLRSQKFAN
jgi:acetyl esterase/lipase